MFVMEPVFHQERNNKLREYMRSKYLSHRKMAEFVAIDRRNIETWKRKIDAFCSIINPQSITDEDWNRIQVIISELD